nr:transcription factor bHLH150-like [Setaria viridis]
MEVDDAAAAGGILSDLAGEEAIERLQADAARENGRSGTQHKIYGRRLLDALRATGGGQPRAVKAATDSALALTTRGQTRWSCAILLAGAACSRRHVLVKAGGKIRRRHRRPNKSSKAASFSQEEEGRGKVQERLRVLGRLVPGCQKLPAPDLLEEAVDYVAALQMLRARTSDTCPSTSSTREQGARMWARMQW